MREKGYWKSFWNYIDLALPVFFILSTIFEAYHLFYLREGSLEEDVDKDSLRFVYLIMTFLICFKITYFLRTFDGFSFLVSMLKEVFLDLKFFLAFYFFIIISFAVSFWILRLDNGTYEGLNFFVGYLLMGFRYSLGDSELDGFQNQSNSTFLYMTWVIWFLSILTTQIVLLNFIIAVIGQSYEKVMQKSIS